MKVKNEFYKLEKKLSLYRNNNGERGNGINSYSVTQSSEENIKKFILNELFNYEFIEEWEETEQIIGFTKTELSKMKFEDFVVAVHKHYIVSIDYDVVRYEPGEGLGGAIPYTD